LENKKSKKTFRVEEFGSIDACLAQMAKENYLPVRRMEKPVFREEKQGPVRIGQEIVFEGKLQT
jgi:hypothetical protein